MIHLRNFDETHLNENCNCALKSHECFHIFPAFLQFSEKLQKKVYKHSTQSSVLDLLEQIWRSKRDSETNACRLFISAKLHQRRSQQ